MFFFSITDAYFEVQRIAEKQTEVGHMEFVNKKLDDMLLLDPKMNKTDIWKKLFTRVIPTIVQRSRAATKRKAKDPRNSNENPSYCKPNRDKIDCYRFTIPKARQYIFSKISD